MSIATEFIDFIVPIATIRTKYLGGWEQCLLDHAHLIGGRVWHDDYLFRDGAMSPDGIDTLVEEWTAQGLQSCQDIDGIRTWTDFCVFEGVFGGATLPCPWLVNLGGGRVAHIDDPQGVTRGAKCGGPRSTGP